MPAEWEPHEATWIAWPHNLSHWPDKFEPIPVIYGKFVNILAESEEVFICVNDAKMEASAREHISAAGMKEPFSTIQFFHIPTDASWSRDHGPIVVKNERGERIITDWIFNAWGNKYKPYDQDDVVPQKIGKILNIPVMQPGIVMEGGSIEVNGKGTLLTTTQCLLNKNRNPELTKAQIEAKLREYLGITNFLWLHEGIVGDDTDGHIDDIARFTDERTVVCCVEENKNDENYAPLQENFSLLRTMKDQDGQPLNVVALPMPAPVVQDGQRLPASYANFYIANTVVVVPTFRCSQDSLAIEVLQKLFPTRKVIGIDCVDLVWGLGTLHCSTQQWPLPLADGTSP